MIALLLLILSTGSAQAGGNFGITTGLDLGGWRSTFTQQAYGQKASISTPLAPALSPNFGFLFGKNFYAEYAPYIYRNSWFSRSKDRIAANEVDAFSLVAFNGGYLIPVVPLEAYAGLAYSNYGFNSGTNNSYRGYLGKLGLTYRLELSSVINLKFKFEYQRHFITNDDAGQIPASFNTTAHLYVLTVGFNFSKRFGRKAVEPRVPAVQVEPAHPDL